MTATSISKWKSWPYYNPGSPNLVFVPEGSTFGLMPDANWDMSQAILQDLKSPTKFLTPTDPQYKDPTAYAMNLIALATSLVEGPNSKYIIPAGWNPQIVGLQFAQIVFNVLQQIPVNLGDPDTVDVFTAWIHGTGNLYGGHPPIVDISPVSAPAPPQVPGANVSIFGISQV